MEKQVAKTDLTLGKVCSHAGTKVEVMGFQSVYQGIGKSVVVKVRALHNNNVYRVSPGQLEEVEPAALH